MTLSMLIGLALQAAPPQQQQRPLDLFDSIERDWGCQERTADGRRATRRESWRSQEDGRLVGEIRTYPPRADGTELPPEASLVNATGKNDRTLAGGRPGSTRPLVPSSDNG